MKVPFLSLTAIHREIASELDAAYRRVMDSGWYILGEEVEAFEEKFARFCGARHCVGVGNGLDALSLTLRAWGIGEGDEVIVPSNTYIATWLAASHVGARPVPVEPDPATYNIDPDRIESAITPRTRAILPVHLYGQAADMEPIREIGARRGVRILEDAAQAAGARHAGRRSGVLGDAAGFSFYPTKNLGAFGDAGAVVTDDAELAQRVRTLGNYGSRAKYVNDVKGFNSRLDPLQAALLGPRLDVLDEWNQRRARIAKRYLAGLAGTPLVLPATCDGNEHTWHVFVVRSKRRDALQAALAQRGVGTMIHYPTPPHLQQAYADLGFGRGSFPISEAIHDEVLSLPMGPHMSDAEADYVIEQVRAAA
ncbi:MAG TPA: DegT/DnrJ/EryC1/StrS family aminotransferase [Usitatibacter sp.]|nr:DegT/DnrJ/EryC1/StrS family aminotransferase [Usitatibacter sp.]